jgi:hypothetical protein
MACCKANVPSIQMRLTYFDVGRLASLFDADGAAHGNCLPFRADG